ncbi:MAG: D-tyrosyl-tRNA(Tyr) deacylase [Muribaculaceae bacterium]|nr:D-tyrosyl-tRNA(Tyr) deacylase [Muribaculaceae bacterium]
MRLVIQRSLGSTLSIDGEVYSSASAGLMILVGVETGDTRADADWLAEKALGLRIFADEAGVMNRSVLDVGGEIMAVSQFTLTASTKKGRRPSYIRAAGPGEARPIYEYFCELLDRALPAPCARGVFGADMQISFTNDGPVTIIIDSRLRE